MSNNYSGTGGAGPLEVRTFDLATDLFGIDIIEVSNGTLAVGSSPNIARITIGGGGGAGTVTSVGLTETGSALTITGSPVTGAGTINIAGAGNNTQVILGDLTLAPLPTATIAGTISDTQVAFGTGVDTIGGDANFTYFTGTGTLLVGAADAGFLTVGTGAGPGNSRVAEFSGSNAGNNIVLVKNTGGTSSFIQFEDTGTADSPIVGSNGNDLVLETQNAAGTIKFETAASVLALELQASGNMRMLKKLSEYNDLAPANGQLLIGDVAGTWEAGLLTSTGGTVTITNGAGTINLEAAGGGGTPAGGANEVQFNSDPAGTFSADAAFTYASSIITLGDGTDEDIGMLFNSDSTDYYIGRDAGTESFMWGTGNTIGANSFLTATTAGALTMGTSTTTTIGNVSVGTGGAGSVTVGGTGGVSAAGGNVLGNTVEGTVSVTSDIVTSNGLLQANRGTSFGIGLAAAGATDLTTLGFTGATTVPANTLFKGGAGTALTVDDAALGVLPDGARITVTALEPGPVVFTTPANGVIGGYDLAAPGDAVTFQKAVAAGGWVIISTAGGATPL